MNILILFLFIYLVIGFIAAGIIFSVIYDITQNRWRGWLVMLIFIVLGVILWPIVIGIWIGNLLNNRKN